MTKLKTRQPGQSISTFCLPPARKYTGLCLIQLFCPSPSIAESFRMQLARSCAWMARMGRHPLRMHATAPTRKEFLESAVNGIRRPLPRDRHRTTYGPLPDWEALPCCSGGLHFDRFHTASLHSRSYSRSRAGARSRTPVPPWFIAPYGAADELSPPGEASSIRCLPEHWSAAVWIL